MQPLDSLIPPASEPPTGSAVPRALPLQHASAEVTRILEICNACRYCEGFCAVFPAMTRRLTFDRADTAYLANLCHNCGACLHACQYADPHEFAVNVPRAMARVRVETYEQYAWPTKLGGLYRRNGLTLCLALAAGLALFLLAGSAFLAPSAETAATQTFYAIFSHTFMVALFAPVFLFAAFALGMGIRNFWKAMQPGNPTPEALGEATRDVLQLKYLDGGHGEGCNERDDAFTLLRRRLHHCVAYGFVACFAATVVATVYHYALGLPAPYPWLSMPKLLGVGGGVAICVGAIGLLWLNLRRDPMHGDTAQRPMDRGFIALLLLTAASGLALPLSRHSVSLPLLLCAHLGGVMALFITLPFGKFVHGPYRAAALLKWAIEKRQKSTLQLADD